MRVHGDKVLRRRENIGKLEHYRDAREILEEDFQFLCGYCGKNGKVMHEKFHIDHFVPKSLDESRKNDYYNLVLACPKCNLSKSDKWPTEDKDKPNDGIKGFVDPATEEYDKHLKRNEDGYIEGITPVGESICEMLHFDIRRTDLYWKIERMRESLDRMNLLFQQGKLTVEEKDFYIRMNILLSQYIDDAFEKGE